jgi:hypothetical protein
MANSIDIFIGCETFLNDSISDLMISNEDKIYKKNRSSHGRVILCVRKDIKSLLVTGFESKNFESILVEIFSKSNKIL